jgi:hypothetical protein
MISEKKEVFFKRYLGNGFYLKREGEGYWLGHETVTGRDSTVKRIRISKEAYDELMKVLRTVSK